MLQNQALFDELPVHYPVFTFEDYHFEIIDNRIDMQFFFRIGEKIRFSPKMQLHLGKYCRKSLNKRQIDGLIFNIGLIELISYWKCTCSPTIRINKHQLTSSQQGWWRRLYWKGLGEFFYHNGIQADIDNFLDFEFLPRTSYVHEMKYERIQESNRVIVPIGGGKDSVVTLEQLRQERDIVPFIINPRGATLDCAKIAGFPQTDDLVILNREIDARLLELNSIGYLNGHTPFSAMLAFYTLLVSYATNTRDIALSNESSANEPTIPNTEINHQYSKSFEFEQDFQLYVRLNLNDAAHYYSHLRRYRELDIAKFFSQYPPYFPVFKSCNAGSKENKWCCQCAKCLFAYIILAPYLDDATLISIFGEDLLDKPSLITYFDELTGIAENKPFECVGTIDEVNQALTMILPARSEKFLVNHWQKETNQL